MDLFLFFLLENIMYIISNTIKVTIETIADNKEFIGSIPDWISALFSIVAGIYIPMKLYNLGKRDEISRKLENEQNEIKNQKMLSIERCSKLYSSPIVKNDSVITIRYFEMVDINAILKSNCVISYQSQKEFISNYKALKLTIFLEDTTKIPASEFFLEKLDIWIIDNGILKEQIILNKYFNISFNKIFINKFGSVLNIYIIFDKKYNIIDYFKNLTDIRINIKARVNNPFNIITYANWNALATINGFSDDSKELQFTVENSLFQIDKIVEGKLN